MYNINISTIFLSNMRVTRRHAIILVTMIGWQDIILTIGSLVFLVALIPSITSKDKPALMTSLMTGLVLFVFAMTYITLDLWFSAVTTALTGMLWLVLAVQKARAKKHHI